MIPPRWTAAVTTCETRQQGDFGMKPYKKIAGALGRRIKTYDTAPSGNRFPRVSDSPNRNQMMHKPGSQNRKKGFSA